MGDVLFIVWRESVEAMLIIGILYAWLRGHPDGAYGLRWLWSGVGLGFAAALDLGLAILGAARFLDGDTGEWFQVAMVLIAVVLIVQMVYWMRRHGRGLRRELEAGAAKHLAAANGWGQAVASKAPHTFNCTRLNRRLDFQDGIYETGLTKYQAPLPCKMVMVALQIRCLQSRL